MTPMLPEMPASAIGWNSDIQIQTIMPTYEGREAETDSCGNSRFSPKTVVRGTLMALNGIP